jgi:hypothetical protein
MIHTPSPHLTATAVWYLAAVLAGANAAEWYVAPNGTAQGDGSKHSPWNLQAALDQPASVQPGDTIWLRGGTYQGVFISKLKGSPGRPIRVRQYPNERVTLDANGINKAVLSIGLTKYKREEVNTNTWYWGFEITNTHPDRSDSTFTTHVPPKRAHGVYTYTARRIKLINLAIHDNALGIGAWKFCEDMEICGNLIYHNGWEGTGVRNGRRDRAHGHGIYTQNNMGRKIIRDNIVFNQFDNGIQVYTGGGSLKNPSYIDNYMVEGNTSFCNGSVSTKYYDKNILVGGGLPAKNPVVKNNCTYVPPRLQRGENAIGYKAGWENGVLQDNYFVGGRPVNLVKLHNCKVTGNFGYGNEHVGPVGDYPDNTFLRYHPRSQHDQRPKGAKVFIRPNPYEPGRANITIYNWDLAKTVEVDLSTARLKQGDAYQVRDAQNFFGKPVASGTFSADNSMISIPMTGLTAVQPIGRPVKPARHTAPEFGAFVVLKD